MDDIISRHYHEALDICSGIGTTDCDVLLFRSEFIVIAHTAALHEPTIWFILPLVIPRDGYFQFHWADLRTAVCHRLTATLTADGQSINELQTET